MRRAEEQMLRPCSVRIRRCSPKLSPYTPRKTTRSTSCVGRTRQPRRRSPDSKPSRDLIQANLDLMQENRDLIQANLDLIQAELHLIHHSMAWAAPLRVAFRKVRARLFREGTLAGRCWAALWQFVEESADPGDHGRACAIGG